MLLLSVNICFMFAVVHLAQAGDKIDCDNIPEVEDNCCDVPDLNPEGMEEDHLSEECIKSYKEGIHNGSEDYQFECLEECVFEKFGFLNANNKLDKEKITASISKQFANDETWKDKYTQASNMCVDGAHNMVDEKSPCKSGSAYFTMCLATELIKNCPTKFWTDSANCTMLKEYLDKCPEIVM